MKIHRCFSSTSYQVKKLFFDMRDRIMNVAPSAMGGLARSYRARVHGGVSDAAPGAHDSA